MGQIRLDDLSDRDLLVITVQTVNDIKDHLARINGTLLRHEHRLTKLEGVPHCESSMQDKLTEAVSRPGLVAIFAALIGGIAYAFGCARGWL